MRIYGHIRTVLDNGAHVAEEQGQQEGGDVLAVDVGVGHNDDLVVAQPGEVEVLADTGTEGGNEVADRLGRQVVSRVIYF